MANSVQAAPTVQLNSTANPAQHDIPHQSGTMVRDDEPARTNSRACMQQYADRPVVAPMWREIQGASDWEGLLEPTMNDTLRAEVIRYGELTQVCYDSFDSDPESNYCGTCKYRRAELLKRAGLGADSCGYRVTKYLYATSENPFRGVMIFPAASAADQRGKSAQSNWMGYVAVCDSLEEVARLGRRDIVVCWRGTVTSTEWAEDFRDVLVPVMGKLGYSSSTAGDDRDSHRRQQLIKSTAAGNHDLVHDDTEDVKVERGFLSVYVSTSGDEKTEAVGSWPSTRLSARDQLRAEIQRLLEEYKNEAEELSITITGHSLGGALATVSAYDLALTGLARGRPVQLDVAGAAAATAQEKSPEGANVCTATMIPITVFTFGSPRVGNAVFKRHCARLNNLKMLRFVNHRDIVPKVPGILVNESLVSRFFHAFRHTSREQRGRSHISTPRNIKRTMSRSSSSISDYDVAGCLPVLHTLPWTYFHVGTQVLLDNQRSSFLKPTHNPHFLHNLEVYLHLIDGYSGPRPDQGFIPHGRDLALVNKHTSLLLDEYGIPSFWWQEGNKGLYKDANGRWAPNNHRDLE